jgi:hypothetical protein
MNFKARPRGRKRGKVFFQIEESQLEASSGKLKMSS